MNKLSNGFRSTSSEEELKNLRLEIFKSSNPWMYIVQTKETATSPTRNKVLFFKFVWRTPFSDFNSCLFIFGKKIWTWVVYGLAADLVVFLRNGKILLIIYAFSNTPQTKKLIYRLSFRFILFNVDVIDQPRCPVCRALLRPVYFFVNNERQLKENKVESGFEFLNFVFIFEAHTYTPTHSRSRKNGIRSKEFGCSIITYVSNAWTRIKFVPHICFC